MPSYAQLAVGLLAAHAAVLDEAAVRAVPELDVVALGLAAVGAGFFATTLVSLVVHCRSRLKCWAACACVCDDSWRETSEPSGVKLGKLPRLTKRRQPNQAGSEQVRGSLARKVLSSSFLFGAS